MESFREAGRRGAELSMSRRSAEQRSTDGKRGAEARKRKLDSDPVARAQASEVGKKNGSAWWAKLTPEQQEAHKRKSAEAGKSNAPKKVKTCVSVECQTKTDVKMSISVA
jgi:serine/threonine protein kinase HipA of HipAB toxin-antitoxin module